MNANSICLNSNRRDVLRRGFYQGLVVLAITLLGIASTTAAELGLVKQKPASGRFVETKRGFMVPYKTTIPGTKITFEMVPIPGGKFTMGSPASEKHRKSGEGPQIEIIVKPFWMGKHEITWGEYKQYMALRNVFKDIEAMRSLLTPVKGNDPNKERRTEERDKLLAILKKHPALKKRLAKTDKKVDAMTAPTSLYDPATTFESGEDPRQPAVTITQYSAKQYTKWLSYLTSNVYRLPAESEWEYACRAGTTTAYHFGDDPKTLGEYAWHFDNADEKTHIVGKLKPNPWGLYDMHGNVAEWVLDEYREPGYKKSKGKPLTVAEALAWPTKLDPRILRGGHWDDDADRLRSAARMKSNVAEWKVNDPDLPMSPWWFSNAPATGVGFRILRPLDKPTKKEKAKFWDIDIKTLRDDVSDRLNEGRGVEGTVDPQLPKTIESLEAIKKMRQNR